MRELNSGEVVGKPPRSTQTSAEIDVGRHRAQRAAVAAALDRKRLHIVSKTFGRGKMTAVVSVYGIHYRADQSDLVALEAGTSPADLELQLAPDEEDDD